jgi:hypothetical protein
MLRSCEGGVQWVMPQFYFHVRQKTILFEDTRGGEFKDVLAAWEWALSDARSMMQRGEVSEPADQCWLEICDATGAGVATLPFLRAMSLN